MMGLSSKEGSCRELGIHLMGVGSAGTPVDPIQMILSSLKETPEGRRGPGRLAPSVTTAGRALGTWP